MNLEDALNSLKEAFTGKSAEAEAKTAELTNAMTALESLKAENATLAGIRDSLNGDKVALEAKVASLEAELAKAVEAQKAAEAKIETAGKKAAAIAASVGVDEPVEVSPAGQAGVVGKSNEELAEEWAVLRRTDPKAASDFYTKHRSAIIAAAGLR